MRSTLRSSPHQRRHSQAVKHAIQTRALIEKLQHLKRELSSSKGEIAKCDTLIRSAVQRTDLQSEESDENEKDSIDLLLEEGLKSSSVFSALLSLVVSAVYLSLIGVNKRLLAYSSMNSVCGSTAGVLLSAHGVHDLRDPFNFLAFIVASAVEAILKFKWSILVFCAVYAVDVGVLSLLRMCIVHFGLHIASVPVISEHEIPQALLSDDVCDGRTECVLALASKSNRRQRRPTSM